MEVQSIIAIVDLGDVASIIAGVPIIQTNEDVLNALADEYEAEISARFPGARVAVRSDLSIGGAATFGGASRIDPAEAGDDPLVHVALAEAFGAAARRALEEDVDLDTQED
jgi:hypothetical protein